ncbi:hypothetical protein ACRAWD_23620 [Caulobacter segnis]
MSTPVFDLDLLPFAALMGVTVTHAAPDRVEGRLVVRPDLCTAGGILHGGAAMALADTLGAIGAFLSTPEGQRTTTLEKQDQLHRLGQGREHGARHRNPAAHRQALQRLDDADRDRGQGWRSGQARGGGHPDPDDGGVASMFESRHVSIRIHKPAAEVYAFTREPESFTKWAAGLASGLTRDGDPNGLQWIAHGPGGDVKVRFSPPNDYGVLDHWVTLPDGTRVSTCRCAWWPTARGRRSA